MTRTHLLIPNTAGHLSISSLSLHRPQSPWLPGLLSFPPPALPPSVQGHTRGDTAGGKVQPRTPVNPAALSVPGFLPAAGSAPGREVPQPNTRAA